MKDLKLRIILITAASAIFLIFHLIAYIYNMNVFKEELNSLERAHDFMEDVLELRRYEKNFAFGIDVNDLSEVLLYISKIEKDSNEFMLKQKFPECKKCIVDLKEKLAEYKKIITEVKNKKKPNVNKIRELGHEILTIAKKILSVNKVYVNKSLNRLLLIPSVLMFLFGTLLIIFLIFITYTLLKQIKFIQETTIRIANGDFSYIPTVKDRVSSFAPIIEAFNLMIKELEAREKDLLQAKKLASVGTLVSGVAHELNNPLNNISLTAEMLVDEWKDLSVEEREEMLSDIIEEARRASTVVKNLLDFSRSKLKDADESLDIQEVVKSSLKLVRNQLMISNIQLITEFKKDIPKIKGNYDNLKQVFINLFLNAIQAMPEGGYLKISTKETELNGKRYVEVAVEDSGVGMPPDVLDRIFDPFFSTKPVGKGTGLGLSIVYGIVKKHGGKIRVETEKNKGTTFFVYFPCEEDA
ncbi:Signal transduction histidine kinase [Desulfonauticus submarinus]|uniref:histidine kinase n=1 Tax=Desulfonauticus submarinus TaxID=206665 RepID=A0A1H0CH00_9BACT|nr:ATP-binding protein [Desulfonauticus submarinus]SDN57103.1 Signal transduction histidine kinase [Desulfonauticus submarinus]